MTAWEKLKCVASYGKKMKSNICLQNYVYWKFIGLYLRRHDGRPHTSVMNDELEWMEWKEYKQPWQQEI